MLTLLAVLESMFSELALKSCHLSTWLLLFVLKCWWFKSIFEAEDVVWMKFLPNVHDGLSGFHPQHRINDNQCSIPVIPCSRWPWRFWGSLIGYSAEEPPGWDVPLFLVSRLGHRLQEGRPSREPAVVCECCWYCLGSLGFRVIVGSTHWDCRSIRHTLTCAHTHTHSDCNSYENTCNSYERCVCSLPLT